MPPGRSSRPFTTIFSFLFFCVFVLEFFIRFSDEEIMAYVSDRLCVVQAFWI